MHSEFIKKISRGCSIGTFDVKEHRKETFAKVLGKFAKVTAKPISKKFAVKS